MAQNQQERRVTADCRQVPGSQCTVTISGKENEVMDIAVQHAVAKHGYKDNPQTRNQIKGALKEEALR